MDIGKAADGTLSLNQAENERFLLPHKAVLVTSLDESDRPLKCATGFIRRENCEPFLYVCWHTATGVDPHTRMVPSTHVLPRRLRIRMEAVERRSTHYEELGGERDFAVDLYGPSGRPLWLQDRHFIRSRLLGPNLRFPFWHDAIKLSLRGHSFGMAQMIDERNPFERWVLPGSRVFLVGFPHGYSTLENPTPVVLGAAIAATLVKERRHEFLLDRPGAPGMSGSPVFLEHESGLRLIGMYTGTVHPEKAVRPPEVVKSARPDDEPPLILGSCANLLNSWTSDAKTFVLADSEEGEALDPESGLPDTLSQE